MAEKRSFAIILALGIAVEVLCLVVLRIFGGSNELQAFSALLCLIATSFLIGNVKSDDDPRRDGSPRRHHR